MCMTLLWERADRSFSACEFYCVPSDGLTGGLPEEQAAGRSCGVDPGYG